MAKPLAGKWSAVVTTTLLLLLLLGPDALLAQERPYRFSSYLPMKHPLIINGAERFARGMASLDAPVIYKIFPGGALVGAENVVAGLQHNLTDVGQVIFAYYPAQFPYTNIMAELAMVGGYAPAVAAASTEFFLSACEPCRAEAQRQGLIVFGLSSTSPYHLISTQPLERWSDLRKLRIRSPGVVWDRWIDYAGGVPVIMSSGETYEALTRGQVDVVLLAISTMRTSSLWDAAKHITSLPVGTYRPIGGTVMSQRHFRQLSDSQKLAAARLSTEAAIEVAFGYMEADELARARFDEMQVTVHEPDDEMSKQQREFVELERQRLAANLRTRWQLEDVEQLIDTYVALNRKWHSRFLSVEGDSEQMIEMLWGEVVEPAVSQAVFDKE